MSDSSPSAEIDHGRLANAIRALSMDAVQAANSGHPGMPMGAADIATVLFTRYLRFDPADPDWPDRDRFVLSAGHGSMLLYSLLHLAGYADITIEEIRNFRQLGSRTAGHPEYGHAGGVEITTGPLGQGLGAAVGMAIAERSMNARFGDGLVDHRIWVLASDGDLMEGVSHEAASLAGHLGLDRLTVFYDDNTISIDGGTELSLSDDAAKRFEAYGWDVRRCDGHDPEAIASAIDAALSASAPSLIACRTTIGHGAPTKAGTAGSHGAPLGDEEIAGARATLDWPHAPFVVPDDILAAWRRAGHRGAALREAWTERCAGSGLGAEFLCAVSGELPEGWDGAILGIKRSFCEEGPSLATRASSGRVLDAVAPALPDLIGGSADLTGSNNTLAAGMRLLSREERGGNYIHYGVREHGMAAAMNGMALHGGVLPYAGTFLIFSDYLRPAIRLGALMGLRVIHVLTHDSIGLGEDGPTHQPVEHLASLRAMPGLHVFRPADAVEVAECWQLALARREGPSVLALTRQGVPTLRREFSAANRCRQGGYVLAEAGGSGVRRATLLATGSEVAIAVEAREMLEADGIPTAVVSMPCWELFECLDSGDRDAVLGPGTVRVAVEAAAPLGWDRWVGSGGGFVGMNGFGASGPARELYAHFGITAAAVAAEVRNRL